MKHLSRHAARLAGLLLATLAGVAPAASMRCDAAATPVEKAICASPALVAADRKMAAAFAQRLEQCPPSERARLRLTQKFWLRDRDACSNALSETDPQAVPRCAAGRMDERIAQLGRIGRECDLDALDGEYRYVDADYLAGHGAVYADKDVTVWGGIEMGSCAAGSADLTATLVSRPGTSAVPVRFKAMPALQREWLCAQRPSSAWTGTVRREHGVLFLYLRDILGEPL